MGWNSQGFEIGNTLDRRSYPTARLKRPGPPPTGVAPGDPAASLPAAARTRNVQFYIEVGANQRSTRSFGPLSGPAIVDRVVIVSDPIAANDNFFFFPGYSDSPVEESLVAIGSPVSWPTWFDRMPVQGADFNAATRGIWNSVGLTQKVNWDMPVKGIVPLTDWHLIMSVGQVGGVALAAWAGYVVVLEGVSREALALYAG